MQHTQRADIGKEEITAAGTVPDSHRTSVGGIGTLAWGAINFDTAKVDILYLISKLFSVAHGISGQKRRWEEYICNKYITFFHLVKKNFV